jgi:two-component system sensor histidine kinase QseC
MNSLALMLRPSLVRRVSLTLLMASFVIWLVLMAYYYWQESGYRSTNAKQRERGELVMTVLSKIEDPDQARSVANWYSALFNAQYQRAGLPEKFVLQLQNKQAQVLFASASANKLHLQGVSAELTESELNGERYHVYRAESGPWILFIGEPAPDRGLLLARLSSNLTMSILISFPLLLLPIWFAVTRGMRPLQTVSNLIASRGPDDLSPLKLDMKYAELLPLTAALDRLLNQLRTKLSREHGFVQDAAHELRTPMAVISAQAHVMMKADEAKQRQEAARNLDEAINRASHLIQQLLDLARIDQHEAGAIESLDLCQIIRQAMAEIAPLAMERQIELGLEAPDKMHYQIDRHAFLSIFHNLLSNALRYSHDYGQVLVELTRTENTLMLSVADDGPGIAEEERALVFERFYRVAGTDQSGSGLGLAIVAQAVTRLHGSVRVETGLNARGCRFVVELPIT